MILFYFRLNGSTPKSACVQYIHFSTHIQSETVLDGYENSSFLRKSSENKADHHTNQNENMVYPLLSLNEAIVFGDAGLPIGSCR